LTTKDIRDQDFFDKRISAAAGSQARLGSQDIRIDRLKRVKNRCASGRAGNESDPIASAAGSAAGLRVLRVSKRFAGRGQKQANWRHELTFST
jgi:hypothetical protein